MKDFRSKTNIIACTREDQRETLYTCPSNCTARVPLVYLVNVIGNCTITFEWYVASQDTHFFILSEKNLSTSGFIQFSDGYIVLNPGDKLEVTPSGNATPQIDALCTVEETFIGGSPNA